MTELCIRGVGMFTDVRRSVTTLGLAPSFDCTTNQSIDAQCADAVESELNSFLSSGGGTVSHTSSSLRCIRADHANIRDRGLEVLCRALLEGRIQCSMVTSLDLSYCGLTAVAGLQSLYRLLNPKLFPSLQTVNLIGNFSSSIGFHCYAVGLPSQTADVAMVADRIASAWSEHAALMTVMIDPWLRSESFARVERSKQQQLRERSATLRMARASRSAQESDDLDDVMSVVTAANALFRPTESTGTTTLLAAAQRAQREAENALLGTQDEEPSTIPLGEVGPAALPQPSMIALEDGLVAQHFAKETSLRKRLRKAELAARQELLTSFESELEGRRRMSSSRVAAMEGLEMAMRKLLYESEMESRRRIKRQSKK